MFTALIVFLFVFSLPLPSLAMCTTWRSMEGSRWRGIATTWATAMAYAVAITIQAYVIINTRSGLIMAVAGMAFFLNLIALQGMGEEEEEES